MPRVGGPTDEFFAVDGARSCLTFTSCASFGQLLVRKMDRQMAISSQNTVACAQYTGTSPIFRMKTQKATEP